MANNVTFSQLLGGYEIVGAPITNGRLPQKLASAMGIINEDLKETRYEPIFHIGNQVVKGMNYFFIAEKIRATKTIEKSLVGLIINIPPGPGSIRGEGANIVQVIEKAELPSLIQNLFDVLMKDIQNISYKPIVYLGTQVVKGVNHSFICEARAHVTGAQPYPVILTINVIEGNGSIVGILPLTTLAKVPKNLLGYAFTW